MTEAALVELLRTRLGLELRELAGALLAGEIPLPAHVVNQLLARQLASSQSPFSSVVLTPREGQLVDVALSLKTPRFLPTFKLEVRIDEQPVFPMMPVLGLRWSMPAMGPLASMAGPVIASFKSLPPGITLAADRVMVDLAEILRSRGFGDLIRYLASMRVTTREGAFLLEFALRIPQ